MLLSGGYKSFAHFGEHLELVERAKKDFVSSHCQYMKARMELSQNFFGFQNWIEDHIGPDINLNVDDEQHKDEQNID